MMNNYHEQCKEKLSNWQQRQVAYPGRYLKSFSLFEARDLPESSEQISIAGRLVALRVMGKIAFAHLQDVSGRMQISIQIDVVGVDNFLFYTKNIDIGDHLGVKGNIFITRKGEKTLQVSELMLLSKSFRVFPDKWHGLQDPELKARYRFLDLIMSDETRKRFQIRTKVIKFIRQFLDQNQFIEVETPILQNASSGASARPFITHHNALDIPLYLRIAPETYLKRLISGGFDRVYEIGHCFRNEGIDPSHLQEFTMLEFYAAYWDYRDNMLFIEQMFKELIKNVTGTLSIEYGGHVLDFSNKWPEITYNELVLNYAGIDLSKVEVFDDLKKLVKEHQLEIAVEKYVGLGGLIDAIYKKYCRPHLIQPTFITHHPAVLVPLARRSDKNPKVLDMFQLLINSWEIVKAYSELVDPEEQKYRLLEQLELKKNGDEEAMMLEEDFIIAMQYGMPPISGLGLGIDRLVALLSQAANIRDVIYFPSLRPPSESEFNED